MRFLALPLSLLAAVVQFASADVQFTSPAAGAVLTGGGAITVNWQDSGAAPSISDLTTYQLFLCAGGNTAGSFIQLAALTTTGAFANGNSAEGTFSAGLGASTPANAYFFKMISVDKNGGTVTNYSPRFTLSGMQGTFPQSVIEGMSSVTGTDGPATENDVAGAAAATAAATGADGPYAVPWSLQTGLTKYASMQPYPPTKITMKTKTPLFPTSPYTLATTRMAQPTIQTTLTQAVTWSFSQQENPNSAVSRPPDDMQKFLNRWKD